ncbi:MAG: GGDEF domain-containing protein [Oleispira sp.]|nr:GGDEF domain-containing protein [Oleispira sp.]MBL4881894.1 GGDEF domain-containing protein [Oleispira sp.]
MDSSRLLQRAEAFNHLFDAVVVTDAAGIITDWNSGSEALYGYSYDEAIGQSVSMLHVPEDVEHITSNVLAAVAQSGKWTGEVRMLRKDGSIGWIESMCIPILDEQEQMIGALGINRDITERKLETEHLRQLAQYDQLTKIPNRNLLFDRISHLVDQYGRNKSPFSLLYFDLDQFKQINDHYGHSVGDSVLQEVAKRISLSIRKSDTIARIGGDEFVLLLENTHKESDIATVIESLSQAIHNDMSINGTTLNVRCSIGSAIFPTDGKNSDQLLSFADKGMYQAKKSAIEERYRKSIALSSD